ncbi:unnamed protein product, partial [Polarella glacialis]
AGASDAKLEGLEGSSSSAKVKMASAAASEPKDSRSSWCRSSLLQVLQLRCASPRWWRSPASATMWLLLEGHALVSLLGRRSRGSRGFAVRVATALSVGKQRGQDYEQALQEVEVRILSLAIGALALLVFSCCYLLL